MRIDKVMHRDVQIIGPKESLRNAAALMKKLDAGALPVSEHDKLIGMITDRDIAIRGQVNDGPVTTYEAGQSFSELPGDRHVVSANASKTKSAKAPDIS